jgi:hypothetical protein
VPRTTPITPFWLGSSRHIHAGVTPTPATPASWPDNAANELVSAVNANNAGDGPEHEPPDQIRRTFRVSALDLGPAEDGRLAALVREGARGEERLLIDIRKIEVCEAFFAPV